MSDRLTEANRRRILALVGSGITAGLAGCSGGGDGGEDGGDGDETATATATETETESDGGDGGGSGDGDGGDDSVPGEYETAESLDGTERDPDSLSSKEAVEYQDEPNSGQQCSECSFYIEDKNGDGMGACAIVEGQIDPEGWCVSYSAYQG